MEVNKVNSWEDVISDTYNAEPIVEQEQQEETINTETATIDENVQTIATDDIVNNVPDTNVEEIEQEVQSVTNDTQSATAGMDEDQMFEYLSLKRTN